MKNKEKLTIKECYDLLDRYKTSSVVKGHIESVAKVSYLIGKKMRENKKDIDVHSLVYAALLHDIFKIIEIKDLDRLHSKKEVFLKKSFWLKLQKKFKGKEHEEAFDIEFGKKYPKVSKIVLNHKYSQIHKGFESWEEKILYYSDKIVMFDRITTLKERLDDAKKRYAHRFVTEEDQEFVDKTNERIFSLEKEIFKTTGLNQEDLIRLNDISLKKLLKTDFKGEMK